MIFYRTLFTSDDQPRTVFGAYGPVDEYAPDEFELAALVSLERNTVLLLACRVTRAGEDSVRACHVDDAVAAIGLDEIERVFLELAGDSERGDIVEVYGDWDAEDAA